MQDLVFDHKVMSLVANIIYKINGTRTTEISPEDSLVNDLGLDSIELIELLVALENIGVIFPESDINNELTIKDIALHIQTIKN